jgi:hypothetical protein
MASRLYIPSNMEITIRKKFKKMNSTIDESLTVIDDFLLFGNRSNELKEKNNMNINWLIRLSETKFSQ